MTQILLFLKVALNVGVLSCCIALFQPVEKIKESQEPLVFSVPKHLPDYAHLPKSTKAYAELTLADRMIAKDETIQVVIRSPKSMVLGKMHFELNAAGRLSVNSADNNFIVSSSKNGSTTSIDVEQEMLSNEPVILLTFSASRQGLLSDLIELSRLGIHEAITVAGNQTLPIALAWEPIKQTSSKGISVFKSKIASELTISVDLSIGGEYVLSIENMAGRSFAERRLQATSTGWKSQRLDVKEWAPGSYLIVLEGPSGRFTDRVILP